MKKGNEQALVGIQVDERRFLHKPEDKVIITGVQPKNVDKVIRRLNSENKRIVAFLLRDFYWKNGDSFRFHSIEANTNDVIWTPNSAKLIPEILLSSDVLGEPPEKYQDKVKKRILEALSASYRGVLDNGRYSDKIQDELDGNFKKQPDSGFYLPDPDMFGDGDND